MAATHYPHITLDGLALDVWRWPTVADLRAHLAQHGYATTAPWARAVIVHHTVRPTPAQWRGAASVAALARYYKGLGWTAGPHLFVCSGCPDPADAGIWQLTPLSVPGTHANAANAWAWGIEHVGLFDAAPMPPDVAALGMGAAAALLDWAGQAASGVTVRPHRAFNPAKSCPGRAVDLVAYARGVAALQQGAR